MQEACPFSARAISRGESPTCLARTVRSHNNRRTRCSMLAFWWLIGIWFVASELFLRASSAQSFVDMDRKKQAFLVLRGLFATAYVLTYGPLAYERGEWDDSSVIAKASFIVGTCSGSWSVINGYRGLCNSVSMAFTLRKDLGQLLRNLSGAWTVHVAVYAVVFSRASWNMTESRAVAARLEFMTS